MSEAHQQGHENLPTPEDIYGVADALVRDNIRLSEPGLMMQDGSDQISLSGPEDQLIVIEKVKPGRAIGGYSLQDLSIDVMHRDSRRGHRTTQYNFNQYGDGKLRTSRFSAESSISDPNVTGEETLDELVASLEGLTQQMNEHLKNSALEAHMGLNNLPSTQEEINEVARLLAGARVITPKEGHDAMERLSKPEASEGIHLPEWLPKEHAEIYNATVEQIGASYDAASSMVAKLNAVRSPLEDQMDTPDRAEYVETAFKKLEEWSKNGSLDWAINHMKERGGKMVLVGTPNVPVTGEEFDHLAHMFQVNHYPTSFVDADKDAYKSRPAEDISGPPSEEGDVRFSLVPTAPNLPPASTELRNWGSRTVSALQAKLTELQQQQPNLSDPTPLETWTYYETLLLAGEQLTGSDVLQMTKTAHISMPPAGRRGQILSSNIYDIGRGEVTSIGSTTVGTLRTSLH